MYGPIAPGNTYAGNAEGTYRSTSAVNLGPAVSEITPLKVEYWKRMLANHPDPDFVAQIIHGLEHGVNIGYQGNEFMQISDNWPSVEDHREKVRQFILEHAAKGRIDGPYFSPPHKHFRASPLGAFLKKRSSKVRVIHDLSFPPGSSINEFINRHDYTLTYSTIDNVVDMCRKYKEPWLCKMDLKDAFMHCMVSPKDRHLLGFTWKGENGVIEYWQMNSLPFGMSSSPKIFDDHAQTLEYMMMQNGASTDTTHYMDDSISVVGSKISGHKNLQIIVRTSGEAGFDVQHLKTEGPSRVMEYTGIVVDTILKQLRISQERLADIKAELSTWRDRKTCSKRDLLSIIGKLVFCAKVVRDGRKFIGRLISASCRAKHLHHRVKLNKETRADMSWWIKSIESHNGTAMFPPEWDICDSELLYSDASDLAAGGAWRNAWLVVPFTRANAWMKDMDIAWRELYAVVVCIATFGPFMTGKKVSMYIDNQAIYWCVNSGKSKNPKIMALIRALYYYTTFYCIEYKAFYLHTYENTLADAISRLEFDKLKLYNPDINDSPTTAVSTIIDF